jgi:hypothetical protein
MPLGNHEASYEEEFKNGYLAVSGQKDARFLSAVTLEDFRGDKGYFSKIKEISDPVAVTSRNSDTQNDEIEFETRKINKVLYRKSILLDHNDDIRRHTDPSGDTLRELVAAHNKKIDDVIVAAAEGTAYGWQDNSLISVPSYGFDAANVVPVNYTNAAPTGSGANTNLTVEKLLRVKKLMGDNEIPDMEDGIFVFVPPSAEQSLLNQDKYINLDYGSGNLKGAMLAPKFGMTFIRTNRLTTNSSAIADCLVMTKSAVKVCLNRVNRIRIGERDDKNYSNQIFTEMLVGATRMYEDRIYKVRVNDAVVTAVGA